MTKSRILKRFMFVIRGESYRLSSLKNFAMSPRGNIGVSSAADWIENEICCMSEAPPSDCTCDTSGGGDSGDGSGSTNPPTTVGPTPDPPKPTEPKKRRCFSSDATVQIQSRGEIAMKDLEIGDKVLVSNGKYESVYGFGHHTRLASQTFLKIEAAGGCQSALEMTDNHLVYVEKNERVFSIPAGSISVDDLVVAGDSKTCPVKRISKTEKTGAFMPLTKSGNIVVNGKLEFRH